MDGERVKRIHAISMPRLWWSSSFPLKLALSKSEYKQNEHLIKTHLEKYKCVIKNKKNLITTL